MAYTYSIGEAAAKIGRTVKTLQRWDRQGRLKPARTSTGRRYYTQGQIDGFLGIVPKQEDRGVIAYCRVSSQAQRPDLKNQRAALEEFCIAKGIANAEFIEEVGGGLNFKRKAFLKIVDDLVHYRLGKLIVAHKDRLVRFGFELLQHLCREHGCELLVINSEKLSPEQEMVQDLMTIVHCFSSRLYGLRNYRKTLKEALNAADPQNSA
jgi:predicted site-specific integrase-resolvase